MVARGVGKVRDTPTPMTPTIQHGLELEPVATLPWLVRLRWSFLVGQAALLALVHGWLGLDLDAAPIAIGIGGMALSNVGLLIAQRRGWGRAPALIGAIMVLDTGLLTLLLMGSGGSANPFTVLYLVHITLSAIVLRVWWTLAIAALSLCALLAWVFRARRREERAEHAAASLTPGACVSP